MEVTILLTSEDWHHVQKVPGYAPYFKKPLTTLNSLWTHQLQITEHELKVEIIHFTLLITLLQIDIVFRMTEIKETVHMMVHDL